MQKGFTPIIILVGILVLASVGGAYYFFKVKTPIQNACTMDAKICPDGSSVGRSGPNCEFAPCPTTSPSPSPDETANPDSIGANWKTSTNNKYNFTFKYPDSWVIGEDDSQKSRGVPLIWLRPKSIQTQDKTYGEVNVWIYNNKTIEEYITQLCDSPGVCVSSSNIKNIKIANLDAFSIKNIPGPLPSEEVIFKKGSLLVVFHFNYQGESYNNYSNKESKQIFDQILTTFQFLN